MKIKRITSLFTSALMAVSSVSFGVSALSASAIVLAEPETLPSWIPSSYETASQFFNQYGNFSCGQGYVCACFPGTDSYSANVTGSTTGVTNYGGVVYTEGSSSFCVVVVKAAGAGNLDVVFYNDNDTSEKYEMYFTVDSDLNMTPRELTEEEKIAKWFPDTYKEASAFCENGNIQVNENYICVCSNVNYLCDISYDISGSTADLTEISSNNYFYEENGVIPGGGSYYNVTIYRADSAGSIDINYTISAHPDTIEMPDEIYSAEFQADQNLKITQINSSEITSLEDYIKDFDSLSKAPYIVFDGNQVLITYDVTVMAVGDVITESTMNWEVSGTAAASYKTGKLSDKTQNFPNYPVYAYCLITAESAGEINVKATEYTVNSENDIYWNFVVGEDGNFDGTVNYDEPASWYPTDEASAKAFLEKYPSGAAYSGDTACFVTKDTISGITEEDSTANGVYYEYSEYGEYTVVLFNSANGEGVSKITIDYSKSEYKNTTFTVTSAKNSDGSFKAVISDIVNNIEAETWYPTDEASAKAFLEKNSSGAAYKDDIACFVTDRPVSNIVDTIALISEGIFYETNTYGDYTVILFKNGDETDLQTITVVYEETGYTEITVSSTLILESNTFEVVIDSVVNYDDKYNAEFDVDFETIDGLYKEYGNCSIDNKGTAMIIAEIESENDFKEELDHTGSGEFTHEFLKNIIKGTVTDGETTYAYYLLIPVSDGDVNITLDTSDKGTITIPLVIQNGEFIASTAGERNFGDVNCDGNINVGDVILLNKYIVGADVISGQGLANAACYDDGKIDINDSAQIMNVVVMTLAATDLPVQP